MAKNGARLLGLARVSLSPYRLLLPTLVLLVAAIYLHLGGVVHTDTKVNIINNDFSYNNRDTPDVEDYDHTDTKEFTKLNIQNHFRYVNGLVPDAAAYERLIEALRNRLASQTRVQGIPVTRPLDTIPRDERFIEVELENNNEEVITVIINTVNAYVMGYYVHDGSAFHRTLHHFRFDANDQATRQELLQVYAEPRYTLRALDFGGGYGDLGETLRTTTQLGHGALNLAITDLFNGYSLERAMLVIIQMLPEAVRIRYIEHLILQDMLGDNANFIPDAKARSIENEWSTLSGQIQWARASGSFHTEVQITSVLYQTIFITNVVEAISQTALALMLYRRCNPRYVIGMPVPVAVGGEEPCPITEPATNIVGRDGKCMDVKNDDYTNGNKIILYDCATYPKRNQLWKFESDRTIRSNGKCLTTSGYSIYSYIMINDCHTAKREATQWNLYNGGTIMNPISCYVIAADRSTDGTALKLDTEYNVSSQAWSFQKYTEPTRNYISGLSEMCLQANGPDSPVSLAKCAIGTEARQQWAFYGDNTIRLYNDRTRCVKSNGYSMLDRIIFGPCDAWGSVRWTFMADGTIFHPFTGLVMDVKKSDVSLQEIILYRPTGNPNQKWLAF